MRAAVVHSAGYVRIETVPDASFVASGRSIARDETAPAFAWQVGDLGPGAGSAIRITGVLSPPLRSQAVTTNTVTATDDEEAMPEDVAAEVSLQVDLPPAIAIVAAEPTAQYSDASPEVAISAMDVAGETLAMSTEWQGPGKQTRPGVK